MGFVQKMFMCATLVTSLKRLCQVPEVIRAAGPIIRQIRMCMHYYIRLHALLCQVESVGYNIRLPAPNRCLCLYIMTFLKRLVCPLLYQVVCVGMLGSMRLYIMFHAPNQCLSRSLTITRITRIPCQDPLPFRVPKSFDDREK